MEMIKGDVVLIPFPFTDLSGNKLRPAVILYEFKADVTVCFITSKIKLKDIFDLEIAKSSANGLKANSILKVSKIATLDKSLVVGKIGNLQQNEIQTLNSILLKLFNLNRI